MTPSRLGEMDLAQLAERGISREEAERQLAILARPAHWVRLERPCTIGDGIERLDDARIETLLATHARAAAAGRVSAFVPASGAATRMFRELIAARELPGELLPGAIRAAGREPEQSLARFADELPRFAFAERLAGALARHQLSLDAVRARGPWRPLLDALLDPGGLDAARAPKGLLPFHRERGEVRTAFQEHLIEADPLTNDGAGSRTIDVTVSPEHRAGFERLLRELGPWLERRFGGAWEVAFSDQRPDTDTLAADPSGGPFRDERGRLLFRPAGHGALLTNLQEAGRDIAFVKNIDNVAADRLKPEASRWSRALAGLAVELSDRLHDRPLRVCGMVANTGEPGGGPFWVRTDQGVTRQIVETAQVDPRAADQQAVLGRATHFNPVFLALSLRDAAGRPHDLSRFVDQSAAIVTRKSHGGRDLLALERPGFWNGGMAHWHTVFVEVPIAVFNPVKTVFDLLRPEHQGEES